MSGFPVLMDDDGIRPAGPSDACFFCRSKIGQLHREDCVTIVRRTVYEVFLDDVLVGRWEHLDPASWYEGDCEFHKNESSWCKSNILADEKLDVTPEALEKMKGIADVGCLCSRVDLTVVERDTDQRTRNRP